MSNEKITVLFEVDEGIYEEASGVLIAPNVAATCEWNEFNVDYVKPTDREGVYEFENSGPVMDVQGVDQSILDRLATMSVTEFIRLISKRSDAK